MALKESLYEWLAGRDTGLSSRAILAWMERDLTVASMNGNRFPYPEDPDDLGRCIRLLNIEPAYRERIAEMAAISPQWARLVDHWDELEKLYYDEVPNHRGLAPRCYARMRELIGGLK